MKWISFILILLNSAAPAQEITAGNYYFILEGDTIEGHYSDFEIENGKFEQYKVIKCNFEPEGLKQPENHLTGQNLYWSQSVVGEFRKNKPTGEWLHWLSGHDCECGGGFSWKRTTYLEGDSIQYNYWNYELLLTSDTSFIRGSAIDGRYRDLVWECCYQKCEVWRKSGRDTLQLSLIEVLMQLDINWAGYPRLK